MQDPDDSASDGVLAGLRPSDRIDPRAAQRGMEQLKRRLGLASNPTRLGRYRLGSRLGRGAQGAVYEAYDEALDRRVALKTISFAADQLASAKAEARLLAQISHPNVVRVFDVLVDGNELVIVMELVEGKTLDVWVREERPSWRAILGAYAQAGQGLAAAHEGGIVHRDFKPSNALRRGDGSVVVLDFGVASLEGVDEHGRARVSGTMLFMAPEQQRGEPPSVAMDVYAFSVAVFSALHGRMPFEGASAFALFAHKEEGAPARPEDSPLSDAAYRALARGLHPDASARWPTMQAMLTALAPPARRGRLWILGGACLVAGVVAVSLPAEQPCDGAVKSAAAQWAKRRSTLQDAIVDAGGTEALAKASLGAVDDWVAGWGVAAAQACSASQTLEQVRAQRCLFEARSRLWTLLDRVVESDDPPRTLHEGLEHVQAVQSCGDEELQRREPLPRSPLLRQRIDALQEWVEGTRTQPPSDASLQAALDEATAIGHAPTTAEVVTAAAHVEAKRGEHERARALFERAFEEALAGGADRTAMYAAAGAATACSQVDPVKTKHWAEQALSLAARLDRGERVAMSVNAAVGSALLRAGGAEEALTYFEAALSDTDAVADPYLTIWVAKMAVWAALWSEEHDKALSWALWCARELEETFPERIDDRVSLANGMGSTYRALGRLEEAEAEFRFVLEHDDSLAQWRVRVNLALVISDDPKRCEEALDELDRLQRQYSAQAKENLDLEGAMAFSRGEVLRKLGRVEAATRAYRAAARVWEVGLELPIEHPFRVKTAQALSELSDASPP